ncbi:hypothetical protein BO83DRAFT_119268 [Aspergillus eucalypticola CBS 122712]|uniref:Uncharacterized protein n=1 Tax=Aspergillus eucalypticola (strain CBS 122712 / IBT 29274) TaxID=1448314 RepID=A0A317UUY4_ASPEC|nr:uncharacterized protein BO83DRAFT_119268 [Aspergillus eucalypticola CBS 122712]PWY65425.1 hypothetical protein BO83DRAFT_119268 [Aspergillus eucalypticola CBS 122712]
MSPTPSIAGERYVYFIHALLVTFACVIKHKADLTDVSSRLSMTLFEDALLLPKPLPAQNHGSSRCTGGLVSWRTLSRISSCRGVFARSRLGPKVDTV